MSETKSAEEYPEPTQEDLLDPLFESVWQAIKGWDISRGRPEHGYSGPTGNDVMHILNVVRPHQLNAFKAGMTRAAEKVNDFSVGYLDSFAVKEQMEEEILLYRDNLKEIPR